MYQWRDAGLELVKAVKEYEKRRYETQNIKYVCTITTQIQTYYIIQRISTIIASKRSFN